MKLSDIWRNHKCCHWWRERERAENHSRAVTNCKGQFSNLVHCHCWCIKDSYVWISVLPISPYTMPVCVLAGMVKGCHDHIHSNYNFFNNSVLYRKLTLTFHSFICKTVGCQAVCLDLHGKVLPPSFTCVAEFSI